MTNWALSFQFQSKEAKILGYEMYCGGVFRLRKIVGSEEAMLCSWASTCVYTLGFECGTFGESAQ